MPQKLHILMEKISVSGQEKKTDHKCEKKLQEKALNSEKIQNYCH